MYPSKYLTVVSCKFVVSQYFGHCFNFCDNINRLLNQLYFVIFLFFPAEEVLDWWGPSSAGLLVTCWATRPPERPRRRLLSTDNIPQDNILKDNTHLAIIHLVRALILHFSVFKLLTIVSEEIIIVVQLVPAQPRDFRILFNCISFKLNKFVFYVCCLRKSFRSQM